MAVIFVTHDVGVAVEVADRIAVMYAGRFVEVGPTEQVIDAPAHPYTAALLTSTVLGSAFGRRLDAIPGMPPESTLMPGRMTRCLRVAGGEIELGSPNLSQRSIAKP